MEIIIVGLICFCIGCLIGSYSRPFGVSGILHMIKGENGERDLLYLELTGDIKDISNKKSVMFKVRKRL